MASKINLKNICNDPIWEDYKGKAFKDIVDDLGDFLIWCESDGELSNQDNGYRLITMRKPGSRVEILCKIPDMIVIDFFVYKTMDDEPQKGFIF